MSQCLNPDCLANNPPDSKFCQRCGAKLLLKERYRAIAIIGQGGFGRTFKAVDEDKPSKPICVIKQFFPQGVGTQGVAKAKQLFELEAVRLDDLGHHPQIPELYAYFTQDNRQYLVQEYIPGKTLLNELTTQGKFSQQQVINLLGSLLPLLDFIHGKQVIHRDIKPDNIIRRHPDHQLILVDFGAAKFATAKALTSPGTSIGSSGYAAPEQTLGQANFSSDIYSLGVTCLYLLTQVQPWQLYNVHDGEWNWRKYLGDRLNSRLADLLDKMVMTSSNKRYQCAQEVREDMKSWLSPSTDYSFLEKLLKSGRWRDADRETTTLILAVANRESQGSLDMESLGKLPCDIFRTIDQLWCQYSNGRFGFSVQYRIWKEIGGSTNADIETYNLFGERVGWRRPNDWLWYNNLVFEIDKAPPGHLPSGRVGDIAIASRLMGKLGGFGLARILAIMAKLEECGIG
ncbi:protein kinase domain-containing protein [Arthrospira platensis]|uniref:protein kinase domain-containing protein n=1 Tax=Limnospira TaxID=2596745 RepID=UPI0002920D63|nr:GUN4 domain-containing protein [Arthrospira platensis]AMW29659.1 protein kinase [Arthrospira platensis YZ]KDR55753.1 protein kinase [Arthrospira platensis str. Paraca]MBD2668158.1 GUN4 domain-containing protein [Arthrospira platensis FACHB-439]MBD2708717.1 GUN4 domain-containing protein [Arthrospira platensis FACHB-835]MDT9309261.1 GUN4 domain-containing protein [Limnospira sp. Paracas R14]